MAIRTSRRNVEKELAKAEWKKFNKATDEWYETWEPGYDCTVSLTPGNPNYGKPERFFHPSRVPKWRLLTGT